MYNQRQRSHKGFSLIEIMVALSLFTIVSVIVVGTLLVMIDGNRRVQDEQQVSSAVVAVLDNMTREIRTGTHYYCANSTFATQDNVSMKDATQDCLGGAKGLSFKEATVVRTSGSANNRIAYYFDATDHTIYQKLANNPPVKIVPDTIEVESLMFYTSGAASTLVDDNDVVQPTVTIVLTAKDTQMGADASSFTIQTTVTQRVLDL